jgi:hypothetical protein
MNSPVLAVAGQLAFPSEQPPHSSKKPNQLRNSADATEIKTRAFRTSMKRA